jgi:hypothetical protein
MSTRHHTSGKFAARGRQPRTEIKGGGKPAKPSGANAAYNAATAQATKAAAKATPGQLVAAGAVTGQ